MKKFDPSDHSSLVSKSRRPHTKRKSKIGRGTVEIIRQYRMRWPHINREMLSDLLWAKHDVALSPSSIGRIIKDNKLFFASSPSHKEKRSPGFIYPEEEAPTQKPENEDNMFFDDDYPDFAIS